MRAISAGIFCLILISCNPGTEKEQMAEDLLRTDRDFAALAIKKGAAEAFRTYFEPGGLQLLNGHNPILGREAVYQYLKDAPADYVLSWSPELAEAAESGDLGWTWGYYTAIYSDSAGNEIKSYGKYLTVWRRQPDGSWLVRADIGNHNPGPGSGG